MNALGRALALALVGGLLSACTGAGPSVEERPPREEPALAGVADVAAAPARVATAERLRRPQPLRGRTVVIDPGHQLGNHNFPREISRPVPAGGFTKECTTTGTAADSGYPEATFVWQVSEIVTRRLRGLGARVKLTRTTNSERRWGPCVDKRGRAGNRLDADLKVSIHADGSLGAGDRGFHVIAPTDRRPWTHDVYRPSLRLAKALRGALDRAGFPRANYVAGGDGLDLRSDLATLNLSDVPVALVELGNMRSEAEVRVMRRPAGRQRYAVALLKGIVAELSRTR